MAKFTDRGWGKEEDPMFLEGLKLSYTQKLEKSTSATPKSMDGKPQPKPRKLRVPNGAKVRGVDLIRQVGPVPGYWLRGRFRSLASQICTLDHYDSVSAQQLDISMRWESLVEHFICKFEPARRRYVYLTIFEWCRRFLIVLPEATATILKPAP